jgi:two-component system LytT family sensor kinase
MTARGPLRPMFALVPIVALLVTLRAAMTVLYTVSGDMGAGYSGTLSMRMVDEFTAAACSLPFVLAVIALALRLWDRKVPRGRAVLVHLAAFLVFTAGRATLFIITRVALYPVFVGHAYSTDQLALRYLHEAPNDVFNYLIVLAVAGLYRYWTITRQREVREAELQRMLATYQLQNLRLQLQPHFLFNALNTIGNVMYESPERADALLASLAELLRLSLRTTATQEIALSEELEALGQYVALMRARFGDELQVDIAASPDAAQLRVPSLVLQPLVENAVRHGSLALHGHGRITVRAEVAQGALRITVHDDGPGATDAELAESSGTGLAATRERVALLYGAKGSFSAGNAAEGGFLVTIVVPAVEGA